MKLSIARRGRHPKTEFAKGNKIWLGRHHTPESKRSISERLKGRKLPDWHVAKISAGHRGLTPWDKGLTKETSPSLARSGEASRPRWTPEKRQWLPDRKRRFFREGWKQHPEAKQRLVRMNRPTRIEVLARASLESRRIPFLANADVGGICLSDLVSREGRIAVFCNGCYWQGCSEHSSRIPPWPRLRIRDKEIYEKLRALEWTVLAVWEHEFKANPDAVVLRLDEILSAR